VVHEHQRRYALDRITLQQFRHCVAVHLNQPHVRLELGRRLFEDRRHRPARTAPACPKINQQRNITALCVLVEASGTIQGSWVFFEQRPMAGAAFAAFAQPFARHAVDRVAMPANDVKRVAIGITWKRDASPEKSP
jgi:hypothetical protein